MSRDNNALEKMQQDKFTRGIYLMYEQQAEQARRADPLQRLAANSRAQAAPIQEKAPGGPSIATQSLLNQLHDNWRPGK